jgi:sugar lactone lactonase YvrE
MKQAVRNVLAARARLGECPVWDPDRQQIFWVDVYNHRVHQFDPATGQDRYFDTGEVVSALALAAQGKLLIARRRSLALLDPATGQIDTQYETEFSHPDTRFNDGKCDAQGRFWIGSVSQVTGEAALYRYDPDGSWRTMEAGLTISNGLGWSPDGATFYLTDSALHLIYAYDFDAATGTIHNRRVLIDLSQEAVEPDGLIVDTQGNLWSALWNGWRVSCFTPTGQEILQVEMPVQRPTCPIFGGASLSDLYITSASVGLSQQEIQQGIAAGDLFCLPGAATGLPPHYFAGGAGK